MTAPTGRAEAIFETDGERFLPTRLAQGPWYPDTQHGGPMLGLLARAVERFPSEQPMQVARLTVDLLRAAPMAPVSVTARLYESRRNVEFVEASLLADGREMARATARLYDERGLIGSASQSLLLRGAEARPERWREYVR